MIERIYEITNSGKLIPKEEIVRCRDCKHFESMIMDFESGEQSLFISYCGHPFGIGNGFVMKNDYCCYGEKKNEQQVTD